MGLDMYLYAKRFLSHGDYSDTAKREADQGKQIATIVGDAPGPVAFVEAQAMYWRKANAIHAFFVREASGGEDNCQRTWISRDTLDDLRTRCREILADPTQAAAVLPAQSGCFFGSTEYDKHYLDDLARTADRLDELLQERWKEWDYEYQASW